MYRLCLLAVVMYLDGARSDVGDGDGKNGDMQILSVVYCYVWLMYVCVAVDRVDVRAVCCGYVVV